ncbi:MAG: hypothetical protein ACKO9V_10260 [Candidatus Kapaibacterium sp.]
MMTPDQIRQMLLDEDDQLKKLHDIVSKTIEEEGLVVENLLHPPMTPSPPDNVFRTEWRASEEVGRSS